MSKLDGDTFYPHHPDESFAGDVWKNTRYTTGGDTLFNVVDAWTWDVAWNIYEITITYSTVDFTAPILQTHFEPKTVQQKTFEPKAPLVGSFKLKGF